MKNIGPFLSQTLRIRVCTRLRSIGYGEPRWTKVIDAVLCVLGLAVFGVATQLASAQGATQNVEFSAPFTALSQNAVTYGQGIVADAASNLYITGTVNLLYLQRNSNGTYTPASTKIDSVGGTAYGLAIDAANNLYRPDIAPGSNPALAKYVYQGTNSFQKSSIGTWTSSNVLSSIAVDSSYNVYVLDAGTSGATTGSIVELTPSSSCSSVATCTTYTQTTLVTDAKLHSTTGLSIDSNGNFYVASGPNTGNTGTIIANSTAAVYKIIPVAGVYTIQTIGSLWNSPAATATDPTGKVWVADYADQKIYELRPASSSPSETNYTKVEFESATTFTCLRTLTLSKTGQLFGLEAGGNGCNSSAIPEVGGTAPHDAGTPGVGASSTQEVDLTFLSSQPTVNYSVVTQGSASAGTFVDVTPATGTSASGAPFCTEGTGTGMTCAVLAEFAPSSPGLQEGAVQVNDSSGNSIGANYLYGVGYGSEAIFTPAQVNTVSLSQLSSPGAVIVDTLNNLYVADPGANRVSKVSENGTSVVIAGTGTASTSSEAACGGGAVATSTNLTVSGIALDGAGLVYLADSHQNRVCSLNISTGVLATVAGSGAACSSSTAACGDGGLATSAQLALSSSSGLAVDRLGNLLIADTGDNRLRSVNLSTGIITTVAGTGVGCSGSATCGDGGLATASGADLNHPTAIAVDAEGDYLIADTGDSRIREVSELTSMLSTVAGSGAAGFSGDNGAATSAELNLPTGVAVDAAGDLYISDTGNNRLRVVLAGTQVISTLAGGGSVLPASNPTSALSASLSSPWGIAVGSDGTVYFSDTGASVVEELSAGSTSLAFATSTIVNTTDATDGAQTASLVNIGNLALTAVNPGISVPSDYTRLTGNTGDCTTSFSLQSGTSCNLRIEFAPQTTGPRNESLSITDNALGASSATQTVALFGTGQPNVPALSLSPDTVSSATVGSAYEQTFSTSGGTAPYIYVVASGTLPPGLTFSSSGVLSGTPTATGQFTFTITATDSISDTIVQAYSLLVESGTASVTLSNLSQTYTGSPLAAVVTTNPAALSVNLTYNGSSTAPTAAGTYTVVATVDDSNYQGTATGTLVIGKQTASVTLSSLNPTYTGSPVAAVATTNPAGLAVSITYNGSPTAPTAAGTYNAVATINDANYSGTSTGNLVVGQATASVTLSNLNAAYTGSAVTAAATTTPGGLSVNLTYNGSSTAPTVAGTYAVVGTVSDPNYQGSATGTLVVAKAQPVITWPSPAAISYGASLSSQQLNAQVNGVAGTFVYSPAAGATLSAGANQTLSVTFTPADTTDYATLTHSVLITVNQAQIAVAVASNTNSAIVQNPITLTVTLSHTAALPTGTVAFLDGTTPLGTSSVTGGVATFTTSALSAGSHNLSAVYSGDSNYPSSSSTAIPENVVDFAVNSTSGNTTGSTGITGGDSGATLSQTVVPGGTASYTISIAPTAGETLPMNTELSVTGLPAGATASLLSAGWTQLTSTSWVLPAYASLQDVSLSFRLPGQSAALREQPRLKSPGGYLPAIALGLFLMPFGRWRRMGTRISRKASTLLLVIGFALSTLGLTGCGTQNGFFGQAQKSYVVTVTVTAGVASHSQNLTLRVE